MTRLLLIAVLYFSLSPLLYAQGESDWWYFGSNAGLHFSNDTVEAVYDGIMISDRGVSSISNNNGDLLFYTDGEDVYNNAHDYMENGLDINGVPGLLAMSFQSINDNNSYHLVDVKSTNWGTVGHGIIDMTANSGLGVVSEMEYFVDSVLEYMTATRHANGTDYWVVFRKGFGNTFISYAITENGFDWNNPVFSQSGDEFHPISVLEPFWGSLRINPQGNLLAFTHMGGEELSGEEDGKLELFHFNNETGEVGERIVKLDSTNTPKQFETEIFAGASTEFSLDGEKLYSSGYVIYQCNISILDSLSIVQSTVRLNDVQFGYIPFGLQLAKDGRIYISNSGLPWLSVIHHPDIAGVECGFSFYGIDLSPRHATRFLPNFDPSLFSSGFTVSNRCVNTETQFNLIYDMDYQYIHWDFGDGSTSEEWEPIHSYSAIGTYTVELISVINNDTLIKIMEVIIEGPPSVDLGIDSTLLCDGDTLLLNAYYYASYYTWQDSSYQSNFPVTEEGEYFVEVKNICGTASDTVGIEMDKDEISLGEDTLICTQEPLLLLANQPSATNWLWQDGSTLPFYEAENTGEYFVLVTTPCLLIYDSISVETQDCGLIAPNIFTPNNDGVNDTFSILNLNELNYKWSLEVYNRWGLKVYFSLVYQNEWKAVNLNDGVYFYIFRSSDTATTYKGSVTVVRE